MTALIGTNPDQIPINSMLGGMAYQDPSSVSISGLLVSSGSDTESKVVSYSSTGASTFTLQSGDGTTSSKYNYIRFVNSQSSSKEWRIGNYGSDNFTIRDHTDGFDRFVISTNGDGTFLSTGALKLHEGTTAQRPSSPTEGMIRKNSTISKAEMYLRGGWEAIAEERDNRGYRNLLDNGSFIVNNRLQPVSISGGSVSFATDRWKVTLGTPTINISCDQDMYDIGQSYGGGLSVLTNVSATPGSSDINTLMQVFPVFPRKNSQSHISFVCKSDITGTYSCGLYSYTLNKVYITTFNIPTAGVSTKIQLSIPSSGSGILEGDMILFFNLGCGSSKLTSTLNSWITVGTGPSTIPWGATGSVSMISNVGMQFLISEVQYEFGPTPTTFEQRSLTEENLNCYRYFQRIGNAGNIDLFNVGVVKSPDATCSYMSFGKQNFIIPMHSTPAITIYNPYTGNPNSARNFNASTNIAVSVERINTGGFTPYVNNVSVTTGQEVGFNYTADTGY